MFYFLLAHGVFAQQPPEESLKSLQPADGVSVSLWAHEPMLNNPTAMDIDSRGRIWIAEGKNYRMKLKKFEGMDRIEGADKIRILEDTDFDGRADKVTDFADNIFPVPLGLAIEEMWVDGVQTGTRAYIGNAPDLLVLEDTDGDDRADRRYPLLTGFHGVDSDHGLHGMSFGPDGKLYFTVGDARYGADNVQAREETFDVIDRSGRHIRANNFGTTLRVNRDGTQLALLSSGHRNNYEAAVDSFGNVFGSDNDDDGNRGCRMYWTMNAGRYGYQHPQSTRHWAEELPGIIPKLVGTGNGAPGGLLVYEGGLLPERYVGAVLQIDSGTHQVNCHPLIRHGGGFRSDYQVLLSASDDWFRPVDISVAPDGSVFVCDWYDAGVGGNRFSDQTTGRIYRLSATTANAQQTSSPSFDPIAGLKSPNIAARLAARDHLLTMGSDSRPKLLQLFRSGNAIERARALAVLNALPQTGPADTLAALRVSEPRVREAALKLLAEDTSSEFDVEGSDKALAIPSTLSQALIQSLAVDPDAGVRRELLMVLRHVSTAEVDEVLRKCVSSWDGQDRFYLEAIRAAVANRETEFLTSLFTELADQAVRAGWDGQPVALPPYYPIGTNDAFLHPDDQLLPANKASIVIGLAWVLGGVEAVPAIAHILKDNRSEPVEQAAIIALAAIENPRAGELLLTRYNAPGSSPGIRSSILRALARRVGDQWQTLATNTDFQTTIHAALTDDGLCADALAVIVKAKLVQFANALVALAMDADANQQVRAAAIVALGKLQHRPIQAFAIALLEQAKQERSVDAMAAAALEALGSLSGEQQLVNIVRDESMPAALRQRALQLATTTASGAQLVMELYLSKSLPTELASEFLFLVHNHSDRKVQQLAARELPKASGTNNNVFDANELLSLHGDKARGKQLFESHQEAACARCHLTTGEGNLVGPNLASIGMKYGAKELLYHIQYPSAAINYNFVSNTFLMADGKVITGLVLDRNGDKITLGLATGQRANIDAGEVDGEQTQAVSLMPSGLIAKFTPQQVADLLEYLVSLRQGDVASR